jgi:putative membrane protein
MVNTTSTLSEPDRQRVGHAIAEAESRATAEFVVVVARRSGRYDRSEDVFGLVLGLGLLLAVAVLWPRESAHGSWDATLRLPFGLPLTALIVAAGFVGGVVLATKLPALARPFRTRREMEAEVRRRAADCFADFRVRDAGGTGVLIYVSLLERTVWITADDGVQKIADATLWKRVRDRVVGGLAHGSLADGLSEGLAEAAAGLATAMPPTPGGAANRLPNMVREVA